MDLNLKNRGLQLQPLHPSSYGPVRNILPLLDLRPQSTLSSFAALEGLESTRAVGTGWKESIGHPYSIKMTGFLNFPTLFQGRDCLNQPFKSTLD